MPQDAQTPALADRAYARLTVKAAEENGRRMLRGMATTPAVDRMGDTIDPMGVSYAPEMPFLWQHNHDQPIGWVKFGKPTQAGIPFEAEVAQATEPGPLKDFLDTCWQQISLGLVRAVSVGFRALKWAWIGEYEGIEYQEIEVYELSAVTIPANAEAVITQVSAAKAAGVPAAAACLIKSFDGGANAVRTRPGGEAATESPDPAAAAPGQTTADPAEPPARRGHVAKLAGPARVRAPYVINRIHPAR